MLHKVFVIIFVSILYHFLLHFTSILTSLNKITVYGTLQNHKRYCKYAELL